MKISIKLFVVTLLVSSCFLSAYAGNSNKIVGTWEYSAPSAPYPYSEGQFVIKEVGKNLVGEIVLDGNNIPCSKISFVNNELSMRFEVDYDYILVKMKLDGELLKGEADSPEGYIPVTAKKK